MLNISLFCRFSSRSSDFKRTGARTGRFAMEEGMCDFDIRCILYTLHSLYITYLTYIDYHLYVCTPPSPPHVIETQLPKLGWAALHAFQISPDECKRVINTISPKIAEYRQAHGKVRLLYPPISHVFASAPACAQLIFSVIPHFIVSLST